MSDNDWKMEMCHFLELFQRESTQSLRVIKRSFGASGRMFDDDFHQYFQKMLARR